MGRAYLARRRVDKIAEGRVDELDRLPDRELLGQYEVPRKELLTDDRGRRYEARISARRDGRDLELAVDVVDLPRRRALSGSGFCRRDGQTTVRTARLYFGH